MLEASIRLDQNVGLLTRPSKHRLVTESGAVQWVTADPLLVQLVMAIKSSSVGAVFKSSSGKPIPLDAGALDLLAAIDEQVWEHWWATHHLHGGYGRGRLGTRLRVWAAVVKVEEERLQEALRLTGQWVKEIQSMLQPLRTWEIHGHCPWCRADYLSTKDDAGETVKRPVLSVFFDTSGSIVDGAYCASCRYVWARGDVEQLARFVAAQGICPEEVEAS